MFRDLRLMGLAACVVLLPPLLLVSADARADPPAASPGALPSGHLAARLDAIRDPASGLTRPDGRPYDGSGISIAIVDTGIDTSHPLFNDGSMEKVPVFLQPSCVDTGSHRCDTWVPGVVDGSGHGTAVAGIAAGFVRSTAAGRPVGGVAAGATLIVLGEPDLSPYNHLSALSWIADHHADPCGDGSCPPIRVVVTTWGFPQDLVADHLDDEGTDLDTDRIIPLMDRLLDEGLVVSLAVGQLPFGADPPERLPRWMLNERPGFLRVTGYDDFGTGTPYGATDGWAVTGRPDDLATYPDIAAPNVGTYVACRGGRCRDAVLVDPDYSTWSGTSLAAPFAAGVVAILLEADPTLTPAEIEDVLEDTAHAFGFARWEVDPTNGDHPTAPDRGHGLVDAAAALARVLGVPEPADLACDPFIADPIGDATEVVEGFPTGLPASVADPGVDVTGATFDWDAGNTLRVEIGMVDLDADQPGTVTWKVRLDHLGAIHHLRVSQDDGAGPTFELLDEANGHVADLPGALDDVADAVHVRLPNQVLVDAGRSPFAVGDQLTGIRITTQRRHAQSVGFGSTTGFADNAAPLCPFLIGEESP